MARINLSGFWRLLSRRALRRWFIPALFIVLALGTLFRLASLFGSPGRDGAAAVNVPLESPAEGAFETSPSSTPQEDGESTSDSRLTVIPEKMRPGEPITVILSFPPGAGELSEVRRAELMREDGKILGKANFFLLNNDFWETPPGSDPPIAREAASRRPYPSILAAILAIPTTASPGKAYIRLVPPAPGVKSVYLEPREEHENYAITIDERDFISETIELNRSNTNIRVQPDPQKTAESNQLWAILNRTGSEVYAPGAFVSPTTITRRTSFFGDRRVYQYFDGAQDTAIHAGVDYGSPLGTPVTACAPGKVLLARYRISTGYSAILEHLPGVYSLYYHLDSLAVEEGDVIPAGTLLGPSGSTGLSTGPHLHWEIRIAGENADPDAMMARPILDKTAILGKIER